MAAAVFLGMTRFAYALLLPPMRDDLSWTYTLAGAMNTFNALGYLLGALLTPWALWRWGAVRVLIAGSMLASVLMASTGFFTDALYLLAQRFLAGAASASVFVSGGLLCCCQAFCFWVLWWRGNKSRSGFKRRSLGFRGSICAAKRAKQKSHPSRPFELSWHVPHHSKFVG